MRRIQISIAIVFVTSLGLASTALAADICQKYGPQTPRDITNKNGTNPRVFRIAPAPGKTNLCNIHFHTNAEHKGPGFKIFAGKGEHGGYKCNDTSRLTKAELKMPVHSACHGVKPGDTIEVHWVYSSCDVAPGKGLGACLSKQCANPTLRVETQVFLVVNDRKARNFGKYVYGGHIVHGLYQPKALPTGTGKPVTFLGSTTGPQYTQAKCSPLRVTWSVRPLCAKVDIHSLDKWCEDNVFQEDHAHGIRQLVTGPALLSRIK